MASTSLLRRSAHGSSRYMLSQGRRLVGGTPPWDGIGTRGAPPAFRLAAQRCKDGIKGRTDTFSVAMSSLDSLDARVGDLLGSGEAMLTGRIVTILASEMGWSSVACICYGSPKELLG